MIEPFWKEGAGPNAECWCTTRVSGTGQSGGVLPPITRRWQKVQKKTEKSSAQWSATVDNLDSLIARSRTDFPELTIRSILFDADKNLVVLQGQAEAVLVRDRANHLAYGPADALVDLRRGEDLGWHFRVSEAADPLHFGTLGGTPTRLVWALFGVLLTLLSVSGLFIYGLRLSRRSRPGSASSAMLFAIVNSSTLVALPCPAQRGTAVYSNP